MPNAPGRSKPDSEMKQSSPASSPSKAVQGPLDPSVLPVISTLIMGIVNVTPDSFSDGGDFLDPGRAFAHMEELAADGADILDIGAESSRPGAQAVSIEEEWRRLQPLLERISRSSLTAKISLDTYKGEIMRRALDYSVAIINDIKGGEAGPEILSQLAVRGLTYLAMHMHRDPQSMQAAPLKKREALASVAGFYEATERKLLSLGFPAQHIWLDPGIGFGKTDAANLCLLQQAQVLAHRYSLVIGVSRKSFMGRLLDLKEPLERDPPSKILELSCMLAGVKAIRTHEVARIRRLRDLLQGQD